MKAKFKLKLAVDIFMALFLLIVMGYHLWDDLIHEIAGTLFVLLFILHQLLNIKWYKNTFKGKYTPSRIFITILNFSLLVFVLMLMYSGIVMSKHLFVFLPIDSGMALARGLHIIGQYWGFVLMSLHIGLHCNMIAKAVTKNKKISKKALKVILLVICAVITIYGAVMFFKRDFPLYMVLKSQFVFLDFSENPVLFYIDYVSIMAAFIVIGNCLTHLFHKLSSNKHKS